MKLAITHSKKIPGAQDYSSEGFSCSLEVEIPEESGRDANAVQGWLRELYAQAKASVDEQIQSVPQRNGNHAASTPGGIFGQPNDNPPERRGNGQGVATNKQISFLISLGSRRKLTYADLVRAAQERFRVADLYQLSKQDASALIDELKGETAGRQPT